MSQSSIQLCLRQHPEQAAFIQKTLNLTDSETDTIANLKTVKGQYSELGPGLADRLSIFYGDWESFGAPPDPRAWVRSIVST